MKKILLIIICLLPLVHGINAQNAWINEFHYDNVSTDVGEFIEIVIENPSDFTLSNFEVTLYNGNNSSSYDSKTLAQFIVGSTSGNYAFYFYNYPENGIQNGENDGIALSYDGVLIPGQFLSYEGTLTAVDGPAAGQTSVDIGVVEIGTDIGKSLQMAGTGTIYSEFTWQQPAAETKGNLNNNQQFGGYTPDPEPTNYPTNFTATADGLSITINWTDAVGEQLPTGYLILGQILPVSKAAFETPTDGVPVTDDLDWSDYETAMNVAYGVQTYTYTSLMSGEIYEFIIYPYTNAGEYIDYKTDGEAPTAEADISSIIVINQEDFENGGLGSWIPYNIIGEQVWTWAEFGGNGYAKMNGYADGQSWENVDWLVSPDLYLSDISSISFTFSSAMNFAGPAMLLFVSTDYTDDGNPEDFSWTEITEQAVWSDGGYEWTPSGTVDLSSYAGVSFHLAFRYSSTSSLSSVWELDNLFVFSDTSVGISENKNERLLIYPNPATTSINVENTATGTIELLTISGQVMFRQTVSEGKNSFQLDNFNPGFYIVRFVNEQGKASFNKLILK